MAPPDPGRPGLGLPPAAALWLRFRLRWKRRRLRLRGVLARAHLRAVADRTAAIRRGDVLVFACLRNEAERLPTFLNHYRALGAAHFLIVDNASTDEGPALLAAQPDVSLWHCAGGYKAARYGMDWMHALLGRYGHGHWCAVVDADELLVYPNWPTRPLPALAQWLEAQGRPCLPALMLDLYPKGPLSQAEASGGLGWFDPANHFYRRHPQTGAIVALGGVRARQFFARTPKRIPTQSKLPFVRWHRSYAFVTSTHAALPPRLNDVAETDGGEAPFGVLLHTKFLPSVIDRSAEEVQRRQHFADSAAYRDYFDALIADPVLHCAASQPVTDWRALEEAGLIGRSDWA